MDGESHIKQPGVNISEYIARVADEFPQKAAFLHPRHMSYQEFQREIDSYVHGLDKLNIQRGQQVLLLVKPGVLLFVLFFALLRKAAIPVMIDPGMGHKAMAKAISKLHIEVFIGEPKAHLLRILHPNAFGKVGIHLSTSILPFHKTKSLGSIRAKVWKRSHAEPVAASDEAAIFFTSGSTGPAKAVLYRNSMLHAQIDLLRTHFKYTENDIDCCTFPLTSLLVMSMGLSIVFADMNMTRPSSLKAGNLVRNIQDYKCSHLFCSPMVLKKLSEYGTLNATKLPSIKRIMTAGAPVALELLRNVRAMLADEAEIHTPYGSSEALPITDISDSQLLAQYSKNKDLLAGICLGFPLEGIKLRIVEIGDDENTLTDYVAQTEGAVGEIIVQGPPVSQEYVGTENPYTSKIWNQETQLFWHRMGDLGSLDEEGCLWFYGRKSQRVITESGTLYTIPVERVFNKHPKVARSALVGLSIKGIALKVPAVCIQLKSSESKKDRKRIVGELHKLSTEAALEIESFYFFKNFPVDPRHNAKIYREKLTDWLQ